jgi:hypothetical protein
MFLRFDVECAFDNELRREVGIGGPSEIDRECDGGAEAFNNDECIAQACIVATLFYSTCMLCIVELVLLYSTTSVRRQLQTWPGTRPDDAIVRSDQK